MTEITPNYLKEQSEKKAKANRMFVSRTDYQLRFSRCLVQEMGINRSSFFRLWLDKGSVICSISKGTPGFSISQSKSGDVYISDKSLLVWLEEIAGLYVGSKCPVVKWSVVENSYVIRPAIRKSKSKNQNQTK